MSSEELKDRAEEERDNLIPEDMIDNEAKINVASYLTFKSDKCFLSMTDDQLNKQAYACARSKDSDFGKLGVPVGYTLHNISGETIRGVVRPRYRLQDGIYVGTEETVDFEPDTFLRLPIKYIILLLMKLKNGLKVGNGKFEKIIDNLSSDDYDVKMSNFIFVPDVEWDEENYLGTIKCIEPVSYGIIRNKNYKTEIGEDIYLNIFGNLQNLIDDDKKKEEDDDKEVKIESNAAIFIGSLLSGTTVNGDR